MKLCWLEDNFYRSRTQSTVRIEISEACTNSPILKELLLHDSQDFFYRGHSPLNFLKPIFKHGYHAVFNGLFANHGGAYLFLRKFADVVIHRHDFKHRYLPEVAAAATHGAPLPSVERLGNAFDMRVTKKLLLRRGGTLYLGRKFVRVNTGRADFAHKALCNNRVHCRSEEEWFNTHINKAWQCRRCVVGVQ